MKNPDDARPSEARPDSSLRTIRIPPVPGRAAVLRCSNGAMRCATTSGAIQPCQMGHAPHGQRLAWASVRRFSPSSTAISQQPAIVSDCARICSKRWFTNVLPTMAYSTWSTATPRHGKASRAAGITGPATCGRSLSVKLPGAEGNSSGPCTGIRPYSTVNWPVQ